MKQMVAVVMSAILLTGCSVFGVRSGTEQASYTVIAHVDDKTEVRRYPPQLVAETSVTASDESSGRNQAFRVLFDYISGDNRAKTSVAMTAPVETAAAPETIAMTVPVETTSQAGETWSMRFFLPAEYTWETVPEPTNPAVRIAELPERTIAVRRFSGSRRSENVARHASDLSHALEGSRWHAVGEPFTLFYDPPWTLPFLRRNEVAVPVTCEAASDCEPARQ
ncbi:MAG: heme-binding protein [Rhodospirillales bacterium]|nr:MAG: heme-binding protein [Rhodospirillales bacterium]